MSLQELIELAILDAMGLLDEREQSAFEAAFRVASPAIQAQVRREQTRLSRIEALLPDVTPPAGLRAAVLAVIRDEIAAGQKHVVGAIAPTMYKSRGVSPVWRAAALGLAAAAVVLALIARSAEHRQRVVETRATIAEIKRAISSFRADMGRCPQSIHELMHPPRSGRRYLRRIPVDGWERAFWVRCPGRYDPDGADVVSAGPSGSLLDDDNIQ